MAWGDSLQAMRAQPLFFEKVIADLGVLLCQHRHPAAIAVHQLGIRIDIDGRVSKFQLMTQALQRLRHVAAQVTATANVDSQVMHTGDLFNLRHLHGEEGRTAATLHQQGHGLAGRQVFNQFVKVPDVLDTVAINAEDNVTMAYPGT